MNIQKNVNYEIEFVGYGRRIFPANYFNNRRVGNVIVMEFIFDDGTKDPGSSVVFLSTFRSLDYFIENQMN